MNRRNEKAITLIALVVTIVVLLILAGVSIAMLGGENGIITQAQNAKENTRSSEVKEYVELTAVENEMYNYTTGDKKSKDEVIDKLVADKKLTAKEAEELNGKDIITIGDIEIDFSILNGTGGGNTVKNPTTLAESKANESDVSVNTTFEDENGDDITIPAGFNVDKDSPIVVTEGIVVEDSEENQYVWIPVFEKNDDRTWGVDYSSVTTAKIADKTEFTSTDYTNIQTALKAYTATYVDSSYSDAWYGNASYGQYGYNDADGNMVYYTNGNMTEDEYNELYNNMLVSVYKNGGFYIGRYEMGTGVATSVETAETLTRTSMSEYVSTSTNANNTAPTIAGMATPVSKADAVGYNYISQSQAQMLAEKMGEEYGYGDTTSSLMFGVQWDAVCVFLEKCGKTNTGTAFNSSHLTNNTYGKLWGNYSTSTFTMDRGYYNIYSSGYTGWTENAEKTSNSESWLCTTGASDQNSALNIYDFGGNLYEFTLERYSASYYPVTYRGCNFNGSYNYASYRSSVCGTHASGSYYTARPTLYL